MQIKALIFDFGGVLMRTVDQTPRRHWEISYGLPKLGLAKLVFDNPVAMQATIGDAQSSDVWDYVGLELGLSNSELIDLESDFWKGDKINIELMDYIGTHGVTYRTCILSNAWPNARNLFNSITELKLFEEIIVSAEVGIAKPDSRMFLHDCDQIGGDASNIVFVDDMVENVNAAIDIGMHGILFENTEQTLTDLHKIVG